MTQTGCPGRDTRNWKPTDIFDVICPACGAAVEFFKDEKSRRCRCGARVENPNIRAGCARWCGRADKCLGGTGGGAPLRDRLLSAMKAEFGDDTRRISHALSVLSHAEAIGAVEGGDREVIVAAAILHDIGIREAERTHGSSAPRYQEELGPPIARRIMEEIGISGEAVDHVVRIVGSHHSARDIDTIEFRIIWDADLLVNLGDEGPARSREQWERTIPKVFRTRSGAERARRLFITEG
jgi:hypothetical protein